MSIIFTTRIYILLKQYIWLREVEMEGGSFHSVGLDLKYLFFEGGLKTQE